MPLPQRDSKPHTSLINLLAVLVIVARALGGNSYSVMVGTVWVPVGILLRREAPGAPENKHGGLDKLVRSPGQPR
jgi:hypothetical protein